MAFARVTCARWDSPGTAIIATSGVYLGEHLGFADLITKAWSLCCGGNVSSDEGNWRVQRLHHRSGQSLFKRVLKGAEKHLLV